MSQKSDYPMTMAVRELENQKVSFAAHVFTYQEKGGTAHSSKELGVNEHAVIKTLIMETDDKSPIVILMHGNLQVSTKQLARDLGVKSISPCKPEVADKHTGYQVGGTSPFGTKRKMPVYMEKTILDLDLIYINGGKRGFLVSMKPQEIVRVLNPKLVQVGLVSNKV
ncbi:Cys-tRNA(Pro) deacylase [Bdellovibrio reynosensis]|uniref:Cys-tRNA(Pro)/Cys-tRNA(Cys) deacylase n=1 Tax=Bdellovibrio reynosensis TaxID=2835041 RepID=A0ABY4C8P4_9BACT|nr:Cys-tRNA(Pro) deacylase [Bdellovibrio reynosensis]UOF01305.1 Cys-tRNA(Pro) deacylase [Bdellovibrio reynosensis]